MATPVKNSIYKKTAQSGAIEYSVLPDYNVDQGAGTKVTNPQELKDYIAKLGTMGKYVPGRARETGVWFDPQEVLKMTQEALNKYTSKPISEFVLDDQGRFISQTSLNSEKEEQAKIASGEYINIGTAQQPRYVPAGSAGAVAAKGGSFAEQLKTPTAKLPGVVPVDPNAKPSVYQEVINERAGGGGGTAQQYKVQAGDTLSAIAKKYGVSISDITGYKSGNANLIFPGENLTIGGKSQVGGQTTPTGDSGASGGVPEGGGATPTDPYDQLIDK